MPCSLAPRHGKISDSQGRPNGDLRSTHSRDAIAQGEHVISTDGFDIAHDQN